jgi:hypothetical protein
MSRNFDLSQAPSDGILVFPDYPPAPTAGQVLSAAAVAGAVTQLSFVTQSGGSGGGDFPMTGVTKTDRSGVITLGGQAQQLMAANSARKGWSFQNKSTADMYFNDLGSAASATANNATYLPAGAYYESEAGGASVAAVSLFCAVTNAAFVAKEW